MITKYKVNVYGFIHKTFIGNVDVSEDRIVVKYDNEIVTAYRAPDVEPLSYAGPWAGRFYTLDFQKDRIKTLFYASGPAEIEIDEKNKVVEINANTSFATHPDIFEVKRAWKSLYFLMPELVGTIIRQIEYKIVVVNIGPYVRGAYGKTGTYTKEDAEKIVLLCENGETKELDKVPENYVKVREGEFVGAGDSAACLAESKRYNKVSYEVYEGKEVKKMRG